MAPSDVNNCARQLMADIATEAQTNAVKTLNTISGADTITADMNPELTAYVAGMYVIFTPAAANTGAATLNIDGLGAKSIKKGNGAALVAYDLLTTVPALCVYDGTNFNLINPQNIFHSGDIRIFGAVSGSDCTTAVKNAVATGLEVYVPEGTWHVDGGQVTFSTAGQRMRGAGKGVAFIKKRSNGDLITISASDVVIEHLGIHNDDSSTYTGYNIYSSGQYSGIKLRHIKSFKSLTSCIALLGGGTGAGHWTLASSYIDNTPASAGTPPVVFGTSGGGTYAALYGQITDCQIQPSGNPVKFDACGGFHISDSQIGGWDNNVASGSSTVNSVIGCRVTGTVSIEGSGHAFIGNAMGAYGVTFESGSSGSWYVGNAEDASTTVTNSGTTNTILRTDSNGIPGFLGNSRVENDKAVRFYNSAGTNYAFLSTTSADNFGITNKTSAKAIQIQQDGAGVIQNIVNGAVSGTFDSNNTAGNTRLLIYDVDNGTLERVSVGAADSGGAGKKVLCIPN